jgi:hypothetical protein
VSKNKKVKRPPVPEVRYSKNGTIIVLRVREGTPQNFKEEAVDAAERMAINESTVYTSEGKRRYKKKDQISLFGGIL